MPDVVGVLKEGKLLFQPGRHLPLTNSAWDAQVAENAIAGIVGRCIENFTPETFWARPEDNLGGKVPTSIYLGAMGTLWALDYLRKYRESELPMAEHELANLIHEQYLHSEAEYFSIYSNADRTLPSYWLGETGILLVKGKLQPERSEEIWDKQFSLIQQNIHNATLEPLWGSTGSVIPALFKLEAEVADDWIQLLIDHCQVMKDAISRDDARDCPIWIQDLYGKKPRLLGAAHGFVGNLYPFIRGRQFLPVPLLEWVLESAVETTIKTASIEGNCCNWPSSLEDSADAEKRYLVQWCHGAPGFIISLNDLPVGYSKEFDDLMIKAGELIWKAGPLAKGVGLCHGTDGNGYALLKLFRRTGDEMWLHRARKFAMHALEQISGSYSLWEGDPGLACFLHACLTGDDQFPLLDIC